MKLSSLPQHNGYTKFMSSGYCVEPFSISCLLYKKCLKEQAMRNRMRFTGAVVSLFLLASVASSSGSANRVGHQSLVDSQDQIKGKVVYVCACLKTKSCACMTEAKMEGPCACGTEGGPPMKPVPPDSVWA